jgi:hypothetical protein
MGWYHHELASGKDPFADEKKQQQEGGAGTCPDGMCASRRQQEMQQNQQQDVHDQNSSATNQNEKEDIYEEDDPIYHICQKKNWIEAIEQKRSYYPPTFWLDGKFTRACCKKDTLLDTANEYYQKTVGDWICIEMNATLLRQMGIIIACHYAPELSKDQQPIQCLKLYSGISVHLPGLIQNIYKLTRSDLNGKFLSLDDRPDTTTPKCIQQMNLQKETVETTSKREKSKKTTTVDKPVEEAAPEDKKNKKSGLLWFRK